jgi:hypothetical protein
MTTTTNTTAHLAPHKPEPDFIKELGGIPYWVYHNGSHSMRVRKDDPRAKRTEGVHIVPTKNGARVDYADVKGRLFSSIRDINIVNGKPLYIAQLPPDETDYFTNLAVVYGTTEYVGPEFIRRIVGISGGHPLFIGTTIEDNLYVWGVVHGSRHMLHWDCVNPESARIYSGVLVYAAAEQNYETGDADTFDWYCVVDQTKFGPFDNEPSFRCISWEKPMYDADGHEMAKELLISGERDGQQSSMTINIRELLGKTP